LALALLGAAPIHQLLDNDDDDDDDDDDDGDGDGDDGEEG
jgi:hypothetical protein